MLPDLRTAVAAEYQKDLRIVAERRRLAAVAAPPAALRPRLGRRLGALRARIAGPSRQIVTRSTHSRRKEEAWKPF
jgi:hypothetical protein